MATTLRQSRRAAAACPAPDPLVVCVAGNPNVGKSSLFNSLTGSSRETANCAGVSVDACTVCTLWDGRPIEVVDLPGSYSLDGPGDDQQAARSALLERRPDVIVAVADATNLARSLYLPLQLLDMGYRVVVALNLSDEATRRGRSAGRRGALAGPRRPRGAHRRAEGQGPDGTRGRRAARERRRRPG